MISVYHRDAYEDGFVVESEDSKECVDETHPVDAVFLDLPKPYAGRKCTVESNALAIQHANRVLRRNVVSVVSVLVLSKYKRIARLYEMLAMNVDVAGEGDG